ncbi:hypothetical protein TVAG_278220 [Trichomonas vaginalis G3]|uniref:Uncharacterized protein n=1 Tax=Trichomonas vaginalis (strain ATCC PRA-98 / G3) TaxID=412133 RepID=A2DU63_TRIV3|nr:hypothetical protein TVAGG3_0438500 [Trichomonas vaginalis G3]EAY16056.1 hypothetical protein TVAG_278220 [Trichomonas vaginalis G3]KAI5537280.1 hypothetical protein TVAGG3_0438500 [Trichomonas vaginalis G3]|eukprot:XP_001328279.1 hypothetical protein [Trichomonas vaginalis G3]
MSSLNGLASDCQTEILAQLYDVCEQRGVKDEVLKNAQDMATVACRNVLNPEETPLKTFDGVPKDKTFELQLIYDFLKQSGFNFAANCLKFESQQPELLENFNRRQLGKESHFCTYDKTPYLVQIIREIQRAEKQ